jgi:hypothetical protein
MQKQYTANGGKEDKDEKGNTLWTFGPALEIMEKLGMFKRSDFVVVTLENLESFPSSVLSYTWNNLKWRDYVMGLAIFDRVWCLAETTCIGEKAQRRKEMIMVTDFEGFLKRREQAYMLAKLKSDPTFKGSRCTVESDREIVEKRILESGFASVHDSEVYVKEVADNKMASINACCESLPPSD